MNVLIVDDEKEIADLVEVYLKNENYDFIYSNTSVIDIGAVLAHMLSIPHFWHIREFGKEDFDFINIRSKEYRKNLMNQACKLITVSEALKKKYLEIVPEDKICVVHNGFHFNSIEKERLTQIWRNN